MDGCEHRLGDHLAGEAPRQTGVGYQSGRFLLSGHSGCGEHCLSAFLPWWAAREISTIVAPGRHISAASLYQRLL